MRQIMEKLKEACVLFALIAVSAGSALMLTLMVTLIRG